MVISENIEGEGVMSEIRGFGSSILEAVEGDVFILELDLERVYRHLSSVSLSFVIRNSALQFLSIRTFKTSPFR